VHLDFIEIAICEESKVWSTGRMSATPEGIATLAGSLLPSDRVALEVTGSSWEITRRLEPRVSNITVVSPGDTGISQARAKTDRLDARTLAKLLWTGELEAVWLPPESISRMRRRRRLLAQRRRPRGARQTVRSGSDRTPPDRNSQRHEAVPQPQLITGVRVGRAPPVSAPSSSPPARQGHSR
jgi:hypothetical protein